MEHARQKLEEEIQKQKWLQGQYQPKSGSGPARDKSQIMIALGGIAAGLTIAVIFMLSKSLVNKDHDNLFASDRDNAIHTDEIRAPSDEIAMLNKRVESLNESVATLETQLTRITALTDSFTDVETKHPPSSPQQISGPVPSSTIQLTTEVKKAFDPSHIVNARVNLRPSASLHTTPIAVLNVGTEVEYISQSDDWYYVNTRSHGKGWCSSDYLSPLLPAQR